LRTVVRFARYLHAEDSRHEVPPEYAFGRHWPHRRPPYLFTSGEVAALVRDARALGPEEALQPHVYSTLFGLIASTGLRISEALNLRIEDVTPDGLLIRNTKFAKSRLLPLHPSTKSRLEHYLEHRLQEAGACPFVFTANLVGNLRRHWKIPRFIPTEDAPDGELVNIKQASSILGIAPSTIHRWLNDGFIAGEQLTPGAPWKIRLTEELFSRFVDQTPEGYVTMQEATKRLGVTRQTVLQRVKNGELDAVHVSHGRRKGIRIKMIDNQPDLFQQPH
jgi:excisionase family DNA binding protein